MMNKDKIIKDLKENNRKLKNQYELQEIRLYSSQHKVDELKEENQRLNKEKIILENALRFVLQLDDNFEIDYKQLEEIDYKQLKELKEGK